MSDEIKKFNAEDAMNNIRERIKISFLELLPDEEIDRLVQQEIDNFFNKPIKGRVIKVEINNYYNSTNSTIKSITINPTEPESLFQSLVYDILYLKVSGIIQEVIQEEVNKVLVMNNTNSLDVEKASSEMIELILQKTIIRFFGNIFLNMRFDMQQISDDILTRVRNGGY